MGIPSWARNPFFVNQHDLPKPFVSDPPNVTKENKPDDKPGDNGGSEPPTGMVEEDVFSGYTLEEVVTYVHNATNGRVNLPLSLSLEQAIAQAKEALA